MRYEYDDWGWYTRTIDTDEVLPKTSSIPIPEIPDNMWPNYVGNAWQLMEKFEPELTVIEPPKGKTIPWTKLEYMSKFTDVELVAIYSAAKVSVVVEVWLEKFKLAEAVYKDDPRVLSGLLALEAAGILNKGRAEEIVNS